MAHPIEFERVWKQYQVGLLHHRLGDVLPGMIRTALGRKAPERLEGKFWALQDVTFSVAKGETLGIIGRNGAGKSTALKLLSGITKQTRGQIRVQGKVAALIEVGAGFHPDLTGRENVFLNGAILGMRRHQIRDLFDRIVDFAEVEKFIDTPVKRYSSGMYVRLGFAVAVHVNPDILLIDEVLSVGDMAFQQKCLQRIHELKRQGTTMVFISHHLGAVERICDRAILLGGGQIAAEGAVGDVIRRYRDQVISSERERFARLQESRAASESALGDVRIEEVRVRNRENAVADTVRLGEPATVEVVYSSSRRVEHPKVRVTITRVDGVVCHVATTDDTSVSVPALKGRGTLRLEYPSMPLLPNAYKVGVEISEQGCTAPLDSRRDGSFFTVPADDRQEGGVVHLNHAWEWYGNESGDDEGNGDGKT